MANKQELSLDQFDGVRFETCVKVDLRDDVTRRIVHVLRFDHGGMASEFYLRWQYHRGPYLKHEEFCGTIARAIHRFNEVGERKP